MGKVDFKIKGHSSFHIREGWLRKGIRNFVGKSIKSNDAPDKLAVGANMVSSIRYWLNVTNLTYEEILKGSKKTQVLTEGFGDVINKHDKYFDDIFTLWLIHYQIVTNKEKATSWYVFFNKFKATKFTKEEMFKNLKIYIDEIVDGEKYSSSSLMDDCTCIIKTYYDDLKGNVTPEDKMSCPLSELELIDKVKINGEEFILKKKPSMRKLDKLVVLYIILDNLEKVKSDVKDTKKSINIKEILDDECNAGKVLNLDRALLNQYLDRLKNEGYLQINRTSGLDTIYIGEDYESRTINELKKEILEEYYNQ